MLTCPRRVGDTRPSHDTSQGLTAHLALSDNPSVTFLAGFEISCICSGFAPTIKFISVITPADATLHHKRFAFLWMVRTSPNSRIRPRRRASLSIFSTTAYSGSCSSTKTRIKYFAKIRETCRTDTSCCQVGQNRSLTTYGLITSSPSKLGDGHQLISRRPAVYTGHLLSHRVLRYSLPRYAMTQEIFNTDLLTVAKCPSPFSPIPPQPTVGPANLWIYLVAWQRVFKVILVLVLQVYKEASRRTQKLSAASLAKS